MRLSVKSSRISAVVLWADLTTILPTLSRPSIAHLFEHCFLSTPLDGCSLEKYVAMLGGRSEGVTDPAHVKFVFEVHRQHVDNLLERLQLYKQSFEADETTVGREVERIKSEFSDVYAGHEALLSAYDQQRGLGALCDMEGLAFDSVIGDFKSLRDALQEPLVVSVAERVEEEEFSGASAEVNPWRRPPRASIFRPFVGRLRLPEIDSDAKLIGIDLPPARSADEYFGAHFLNYLFSGDCTGLFYEALDQRGATYHAAAIACTLPYTLTFLISTQGSLSGDEVYSGLHDSLRKVLSLNAESLAQAYRAWEGRMAAFHEKASNVAQDFLTLHLLGLAVANVQEYPREREHQIKAQATRLAVALQAAPYAIITGSA